MTDAIWLWAQLPEALRPLLIAYLRDGKTGTIALNVNEGRIESWNLGMHGRVTRERTAKTEKNI